MNPDSQPEIALSVYLNQRLLTVVPLRLPGDKPSGGADSVSADPVPLAVHLTGDEKVIEALRARLTRLELTVEAEVGPAGGGERQGCAFALEGDAVRKTRDWHTVSTSGLSAGPATTFTYDGASRLMNLSEAGVDVGMITTTRYEYDPGAEADEAGEGAAPRKEEEPPADEPFLRE